MTAFDRFDKMASAAVGRLFNERVIWRPQRPRTGRDGYTNGDSVPDEARPVRELVGAVTWRPDVINPADTNGGGVVISAQAVLDMDASLFLKPGQAPGADPEYETPRQGDIFELTEQYAGNRIMEVASDGNDGSERFYYYLQTRDDE
jgi:hypothetical protein